MKPATGPSAGGTGARLRAALRRASRLAGRIVIGLAIAGALAAIYAFEIEPRWIAVRHIRLSASPTLRVIHITDLHHKGDQAFLDRVVDILNRTPADFVCITGDMVEEAAYLDDVLNALRRVNKPVYGVPGNHDYWSLISFDAVREALRATGGDWLCDSTVFLPEKSVEIVGATGTTDHLPVSARHPEARHRILLVHYPNFVLRRLAGEHFDLMLVGHLHGGQVRIPLLDRPALSYLGPCSRGLCRTPAGPMYVNPGLGTYILHVRFACRPEVAVIEL